MNKEELKRMLDELSIPATHYSLDGELIPDRMIIYKSYSNWLVFYLDERGNRNEEKVFGSDTEAYLCVLEHFKDLKRIGAY